MGEKGHKPKSPPMAGIPGEAWQLFFEHSPVMICAIGFDQKFKLVNPVWTQVLGWSEKELLDTKYIDLIHPDETENTLADAKTYPKKEVVAREYENRYRCKDGSYRWLQWHAIPFQEHEIVYGIVQDITEQKETKKELQESQETLTTVMDSINADVYVADLETYEIMYVNKKMADAFGDQLVGKTCYRVLRDESQPCGHCNNESLLDADGQPTGIHEWDIYNPKVDKWYMVYDQAIRWKDERMVRLQIAVDITERKLMEEEIRSEKNFTDIALNSQLDTFFLFEPDTGKAIRWNQTFGDITGYTNEEISKLKAPDSYYSPEDLKKAAVFTEEVLNTGSGTIELDLISKDGQKIPTEYKVSVIRDSTGKPKHLISAGRDITKRKQAEEALRESEELLSTIAKNYPAYFSIIEKDLTVGFTSGKEFIKMNLNPDEYIGLNLKEVFGENTHLVQEKYLQAFKGEEINFELFFNQQHQLYNVIPLNDEQGEVTRLLSVVENITERKEAEEALKESEEKYRSLIERANDGVVIIQDGIVKFVSRSFANILNYSVDEVLNTEFITYIAPEEQPKIMDIYLRRSRGEDVPSIYEITGVRKDETRIPFEANSGIITYQGKPATLAIVRDVSDRKQSEEALRESEEKYRNLVERANDGITIVQDGRIEFTNEKLLDMIGYSQEEMQHSEFLSYIVPEDRARISDFYTRRLRGEDIQDIYEMTAFRKDGTRIPLEINSGVISYLGKPAIMAFIRDITERKQAEDALKESEERFRSLSQATSEGIAITENSILIDVNEQLSAMMGYKKEELIGKKITDFVTPENHPSVEEHISTKREELNEVQIICKDGRLLSVEARPKILEMQGRTLRLTAIRDITERKQAEEDLRESESRFRSLSQATFEGISITEEGVFIDVNDQLLSILGYEKDDLIGKKIIDIIVPEHHHLIMENVTSRKEDLYEVQAICKDGRIIDVEVRPRFMEKEGQSLRLTAIRDVTDRKQAEEALKESEEKFRNIIEASPMGMHMYELGPDGRLIFSGANPAADSILGLDNRQFIGKTIEEAFPSSVGTELIERYRKAAAEGEPWFIEQNTYEDDKISGSFEVHAFQTSPRKMTALFLDITERKQAAEALQESEERLRTLSAATFEGIAVTEKGVFIDGNQQLADILGYELDELVGIEVMACVAPQDKELVLETIRSGTEEPYEHRAIRKSGEIIFVEARPKMMEIDGKPIRVTAIRDVSERIKAEEALRESELRYRTIADFNYDWEFWINPDGSMRYVSPSCERVTGYTAEEFINIPHLREKIMTKDTKEDWEEHRRLSEESHGLHELTYAIRRKDGELRWIEHFCQPVTLDDGTYLGIRGSDRDVTERKQAEEEIRKLNDELEQRVASRTAELEATNQELEAFAYSISHDLRAPLRAINSFSEILQTEYEDSLDDEGKGYLSRVRTSARRMNKLIDDLLALSRLGRREMRLSTANLARIAKNVFIDIMKQAPDREIDIQIHDIPLVEVDTRLIEVALTNLVGNAVKFTRRKKTAKVEFGVQDGEEGQVFYIKDNGVGFDMKYADKLFTPFQRLHTEKEFEGTGIGLAIVHRIIQRHGGKIWVESKPNKGTTFFFTLDSNGA